MYLSEVPPSHVRHKQRCAVRSFPHLSIFQNQRTKNWLSLIHLTSSGRNAEIQTEITKWLFSSDKSHAYNSGKGIMYITTTSPQLRQKREILIIQFPNIGHPYSVTFIYGCSKLYLSFRQEYHRNFCTLLKIFTSRSHINFFVVIGVIPAIEKRPRECSGIKKWTIFNKLLKNPIFSNNSILGLKILVDTCPDMNLFFSTKVTAPSTLFHPKCLMMKWIFGWCE